MKKIGNIRLASRVLQPIKERRTSIGHSLLKTSVFLTSACTFSLSGCAGWAGITGMSWQEEVLLHDSNKLVVERSVEYGGPHEIGQQSSYTRETLAFKHPATGERVIWDDKATPDINNSNFLPMALDIYQGTVYLVANPMSCLSYNKWGRPNPPYVVFSYENKAWKRIPLQELPPETKEPNLIFSSPDTAVKKLEKHFIDAETIKKINSGARDPIYRYILREALPVARINEMCEERVLYKGYWILPNSPVSRSIIDQRKQ